MYNLLNEIKYNNLGDLLLNGNWGIERETNRVYEGHLALSPQREIFKRDKNITTDFSESQLEIITPVCDSIEKAYYYLESTNNFVKKNIYPEKLWPFSMPPVLPGEEHIPLAKYPNEINGTEKEEYRGFLAKKYGKKMQMISGIHYNFSLGSDFEYFLFKSQKKYKSIKDYKNDLYLSISRHLFKYMWIIVYLFGSSPVCDKTYFDFSNYKVDKLKNAISLRMSSYGYKNKTNLYSYINFNKLEYYVKSLNDLINLSESDKNHIIGPNEFYSSLRIKSTKYENSDFLEVLNESGISYIEFRAFDLNPFNKNGITIEQMKFLHLLILYSIFNRSGYKTGKELKLYNDNMERVALYGRMQCLELYNEGVKINIKIWAKSILNKLREFAIFVDSHTNSNYFECIENQIFKLDNNEYLPSSLVYKNVKEFNSFIDYGLKLIDLEDECCVL